MADRVMRVERAITQEEINKYAKLSFDENPLHVDPVYAASGPFGRTILHGTIPCAILLDLFEAIGPELPITAEFKFVAPAYSDAALDLEIEGSAATQFDCRASSEGQLLIVGSVRAGG